MSQLLSESEPNVSTSFSKEEVLKALDFEIDSIKSEINRLGWTTWALLGSLATIIWLIINNWENFKGNFTNVGLWFFCVIFLIDILNIIDNILLQRKSHTGEIRIYRFKELYSSSRRLFLLNFLMALSLVYLSVILLKNVPPLIRIYSFLFYGGACLIWLFTLIMSFIDFPLVQGNYKFRTYKLILTLIILPGFVVLFYCYKTIGTINILEIKLAFLICTFLFLLKRLSEGNDSKSKMDSLKEIRRDLVFGRLGIQEALKRTDIILLGMNVSQFFQDDIDSLLKLLSLNHSEINTLSLRYQEISNLISKKESKKEEIEKITNDFRLLCDSNFYRRNRVKEYLYKKEQLLNKISLFQNDKEAKLELQNIIMKIDKEEQENKNMEDGLEEDLNNFISLLETFYGVSISLKKGNYICN
jgi:hypothetical protein